MKWMLHIGYLLILDVDPQQIDKFETEHRFGVEIEIRNYLQDLVEEGRRGSAFADDPPRGTILFVPDEDLVAVHSVAGMLGHVVFDEGLQVKNARTDTRDHRSFDDRYFQTSGQTFKFMVDGGSFEMFKLIKRSDLPHDLRSIHPLLFQIGLLFLPSHIRINLIILPTRRTVVRIRLASICMTAQT